MFLGSLIDLGLPEEYLRSELAKLAIPMPELIFQRVKRKGISAVLFEVNLTPEKTHRHLSHITQMIKTASLPIKVVDSAVKCFTNLAEAEAIVHGVSIDEVHFHEVGAIDAIIDIVGACIGLDFLKIDRFLASPIRVGYGMIECAHGKIPIPAPATINLLKDFVVYGGEIEGEWATPTGAAIIKTFAQSAVSLPQMRLIQTGYGAGSADRLIPNVLRIIEGELIEVIPSGDLQIVLETNIDDMNPELFGYLGEILLEAGAKDYYFTPVQMKKERPGTLVTVIVPPGKEEVIEAILFKETTTLGVRKYSVQRTCLERSFFTVKVEDCTIRMKAALYNGIMIKFAPEYEDCKCAAKLLRRSLKVIYEAANYEARKISENKGNAGKGME
jgi:uncharacterized protein (TIGR00299 family) protein